MFYTWSGRNLSAFQYADGSCNAYLYNADGIRTSKYYYDADGNVTGTIKYTLDGNKIVAENRNGTNIYYTYDDKGAIMGMIYGGQDYIFSKNLQGDVIGIYNPSRQLVAKYTYNAYGEITAITNASGVDVSNNATHIANLNPFRYRGYYYDTETGFYYLQSRYYDPVVGRFLNADAFVSTGQGIQGNNMFAYCLNNPVMCCDNNGKSAALTVPALPGLPFLSPLKDAMEFFVNGFLDAIDGGITGIRDFISNAKKEAEARRAEKQASKAREYAASKIMERLKELNDDECAIVYLSGKTPIIYKVLYVREAITAMQEDILAGTNLVIPPNQENWGIFTAKKETAKRILFCTFGSAEEDNLWRGHSPLPHFNTVPHNININGKETTPHAWFLY